MKLQNILFTILFMFAAFIINAQEITECAATIPPNVTVQQAQSDDLSLYKRTTVTQPMRLAIHIVRYSNGTGGITQSNLDQKITDLTDFMDQALFQFYIYSTDYIDSDQYAEINNDQEANELRLINVIDNCINVYFVPVAIFNGTSSFSSRIQDPNLWAEQGIIVRNDAPPTTLPHEMGHYFDLFHTPERYFDDENISRTAGGCGNWWDAGDLLQDTPADPSYRVIFATIDYTNCQWIDPPIKPLPPDGCEQTNYNPLTNNMMITQVANCRTTFTEDQKERMNETLLSYRNELLKFLVYLENSASGSNAGGSLHIGSNNYNSGESATVDEGTYNIGTNDERFTNYQGSGFNYKHNNWNDSPNDHFLSRNITVSDDHDQIGIFTKLHPTKIQIPLEGVLIEDKGSGSFQDPWYVLSDGSQPGNYWIDFNSEYEPTGKESAEEKGVFLDRDYNDPDVPYYSVGAPLTQEISVGGGIGTRDFYFQNWNGTNVQFENNNNLQTGVVFTETNAVVNANLKGNLLSNSPAGISTNSQRKIVRTDNGYYHLVYVSMNNVWYTHSLTTDFYGDWSQEELLMTEATNPSLDYTGNDIYIVYEINYPGWQVIYIHEMEYNNGNWTMGLGEEIPGMNVTNTGSANPVVYARSDEVFVVAKPSLAGGLKYTYIIDPDNPSNQWSTPADIPGTDQYSVNPALAGRKLGNDDDLHISYESKNRIYYLYSYRQGNNRIMNSEVDISTGSSYTDNKFPSISLVNNQFYPIVTWQGSYKYILEKRMGKENDESMWRYNTVVRVKSSSGWGTFSAFGNKVDYPNINSIETNDETIIAWTENEGQFAKYVKRAGSFRQTQPLSSNGKYVQLSNGSDLDNLKAIVFNIEDIPLYNLVRTTDDFTQEFGGGGGLGKETDVFDLSYGRTGVVEKSDVEFVFNIGDIFLNGETVKFIERADTLPVTNIEELNSFVKTENMQLSSSSELLFSNYYYVVRPELADSVLSDDFTVTFKCELVKSATDEVIGVFDQVTYSKFNVEKYDNLNYIVDCNGIEQGEYYFRLITEVNGESNTSLINIEKDNITLEKARYINIGFTGNTLPIEYALSQNYPNPFNPSTTIRYQIPQDGFVTLKVYDILGREITILVNEEKTSGGYEINFDASSLASGVYLYRLNVNDYVDVKKMILLK